MVESRMLRCVTYLFAQLSPATDAADVADDVPSIRQPRLYLAVRSPSAGKRIQPARDIPHQQHGNPRSRTHAAGPSWRCLVSGAEAARFPPVFPLTRLLFISALRVAVVPARTCPELP